MRKEDIEKDWISGTEDPSASARRWDAFSSDFGSIPLPDLSDPFMKIVEETYDGDHGNMLDIGCGTGQYSAAVAGKFRKVYGADISPKMIAEARSRAESMGLVNAEYRVLDWENAPAGDPILSRKYGMVFAHMTPAIGSAKALEKMCQVCDGWCYTAKPARRKEVWRRKIFEEAGIEDPRKRDETPDLLSLVWLLGYNPKIEYQRTHWNDTYDVARAEENIIGEARVAGCTDETALERARECIRSEAVDGKFTAETDVLIAIIYWENRL